MKLSTIAAFLLSLLPLSAAVPTISLAWDPNPPTDGVTNYVIYWRSPTNAPVPKSQFAGTNLMLTLGVTNFGAGLVRFTLTAVNSNALESVPSDPVLWTNRYFAPVLRLSDTNTATLALQQSDKITGPWTNVVQTPAAPINIKNGFTRGLVVLDSAQ